MAKNIKSKLRNNFSDYLTVTIVNRVPNDHEHAQANKFKSVVELKNMVA